MQYKLFAPLYKLLCSRVLIGAVGLSSYILDKAIQLKLSDRK